MVEKKTQKKINPKEEALKLLKEKSKKADEKRVIDVMRNLATRDILERDFQEDTLIVVFETAPGVKRAIEARRPTHREMMDLMRLSILAGKFEGIGDAESLDAMNKVWKDFGKIAADLSKDPQLDQDFWENRISATALQNFISELITTAVRGTNLPNEEIEKFRKE